MLLFALAPLARAEDVLGVERLDDAVPALALQSATGGPTFDQAAWAGKTVLLHFWATWCAPCKEELPALERLAATIGPTRFTLVLVAVDTNASASEVLDYARALGVHLPIYLASAGGVSNSFWGWGLPVSYLIDAEGQFIGRLLGPRAWNDPAVLAAVTALATP